MFSYRHIAKLTMDQYNTLLTLAYERRMQLTQLLENTPEADCGRKSILDKINYINDALSAIHNAEWVRIEENN